MPCPKTLRGKERQSERENYTGLLSELVHLRLIFDDKSFCLSGFTARIKKKKTKGELENSKYF